MCYDFCNMVIWVKTVIPETIHGILTKMHAMSTHVKFPFFFKLAWTSILFVPASPVGVKHFKSFYYFILIHSAYPLFSFISQSVSFSVTRPKYSSVRVKLYSIP